MRFKAIVVKHSLPEILPYLHPSPIRSLSLSLSLSLSPFSFHLFTEDKLVLAVQDCVCDYLNAKIQTTPTARHSKGNKTVGHTGHRYKSPRCMSHSRGLSVFNAVPKTRI